MKKRMQFLLIILMLAVPSMPLYTQAIPQDSLYLGQTPPGNIRKTFNLAAGQGYYAVERIAVSPDGKEIYFEETNNSWTSYKFKYYKYYNNKWNEPVNLFNNYYFLTLSPDGSFMYFENNNYNDSWISVKQDTNWSIPSRFLKNFKVHSLNVTSLGNYYLSSNIAGGLGQRDICKLIVKNSDTTLTGLGLPLNSNANEGDFFISNDESFIIFMSNRSGGFGSTDLYISFRKNNDTWTIPKNMGTSVNTSGDDFGPYVTADTKYLFYENGYSSPSSIYWVRVDGLIDSLKHTNFAPYLKKTIPNQKFTAGHSFSFTIPDSTFIDDDGNNTLSFTAKLSNGATLPSWLSFNSSTKTFSGTPTIASVSPINITVTAGDNANASVSAAFEITVVANPDVIKEDEGKLPKEWMLFQNYPNPFNPTTTIEFVIAKSGRYKLGLYNPLGEFVKEIYDKEYQAGYYKETFYAAGLSSGMYVYRLTGNNANMVRKMVLLR